MIKYINWVPTEPPPADAQVVYFQELAAKNKQIEKLAEERNNMAAMLAQMQALLAS